MSPRPLPAGLATRLRAATPNVPAGLELGRSEASAPPGYRWFSSSAVVPGLDLDSAAALLLSWQVQERSGLRVRSSEPVVRPGTVAELRLGPGAFCLRLPCRVTDVVETPTRRGFTYTTLPGHVEAGLEEFMLHEEDDGRVVFTVTAISVPAWGIVRLGRPLAHAVQDVMTRRYLAALAG